MFSKIKDNINLLRNMGWRYTQFRLKHETMRWIGLLKKGFPVNPDYQQYITLDQLKANEAHFFFRSKESLSFTRKPTDAIKERYTNLKAGKLLFFNSTEFQIGSDYDWITNPDSGFKYDINKHWTEIKDYSKEAGDIKFVWEKSRFSYLYDIIRYDYHFNVDCSQFVFSEILSWIKANPVNCGPNYRCSQETSLRVLNWTFALHYYSNSPLLTEEVFNEMQFAMYWQLHHVYNNIDFSRIAVRNNHAIAETLTLYLTGLLYPQFPGSRTWKEKGKKWFEQEITYQIYEDGTFLQFSMNYHRVVVQLLTWAIVLAKKNGDSFTDVVYQRAKKSIQFLRTCLVDENGYLPNYGANDGALFFKLNDAEFRDYRPQLSALAAALNINLDFKQRTEDLEWYGLENQNQLIWKPKNGIHNFDKGGYYIIREPVTLTFIRCGNHKDRPSQADNLHLDIWYEGENVLLDSGSYKYNTNDKTLNYFTGTASHNTIMLGNYNQMKKGSRFIWYNWTQVKDVEIKETEEIYYFKGSIYAFSYLAKGIVCEREVIKVKRQPNWIIKDSTSHKPANLPMKQLWHLPLPHSKINWKSKDEKNREISIQKQFGYYSSLYGQKKVCEISSFETKGDQIITEFQIDGTLFEEVEINKNITDLASD